MTHPFAIGNLFSPANLAKFSDRLTMVLMFAALPGDTRDDGITQRDGTMYC
jgi:hypothetical protein